VSESLRYDKAFAASRTSLSNGKPINFSLELGKINPTQLK
jgi:hypothetical protein